MPRLLALAVLTVLIVPSTAAAAPARAFRDGALELGLPADRTDGGEVRSTPAYTDGVATARMQVADAPSSITGFFLYAAPDYASEIDIEVFNDPSGTVLLSTYAGGRQTHTETRALGFDPTAAPHDYEIAWGAGRVSFSVDGVVLRTWTTGVTKLPMNLYANAWFPAWLDGIAPTGRRATVIDQIEYRRR